MCMYSLSHSAGRACCAALAPDCSLAAAGYSDSSVLLWDMREAALAHKAACDVVGEKVKALEDLGPIEEAQVKLGPGKVKAVERALQDANEAEKQARPGPPQVRAAPGE